MTTARQVIEDGLTFNLNRLSPGETLDADLAALCLRALNAVADEWTGIKTFLFRDILTTSAALTGVSGRLGVDWATLSPGDEILGATVRYSAGMDVPLEQWTMDQYANVAIKTVASLPQYWAYDGSDAIYLYPAATGQQVTLHTRQVLAQFADLDTDYVMPNGYRSALAVNMAEKLPALGGNAPKVVADARAARNRIAVQTVSPGIINGGSQKGSILTGWR